MKGGSARIIGKRIYLRPLRRSDINRRYLSWLKDAEVTRFMESRFANTDYGDLITFYNKMKESKNDVIFAIVAKDGDTHIGNIKLGDINRVHRYANLGIMIGEKSFWGKGYAQEACRLLLNFAFKRIRLNKVILGVYANHKSAITAYKKAGFKIEGRIKNLYKFEGRHTDKIIMGISRA